MAIEMRDVKMICSKCGVEDTQHCELDETPLPAINCWKCGAGQRH